jgi:hypothetical protein
MERLTTNKSVADMSMIELAHNSCYADDKHNARYRDYNLDVDSRWLIRNLVKDICGEDFKDLSDEEVDDYMDSMLSVEIDSTIGLLALFYRNLWAMADLREKLKYYEDAEEQGLLLRLPCKVGDTLYRVNKGAKEPVIMMRVIQLYIKQIHKDRTVMIIDAINDADMGESCYLPCDIGERIFLTREEAEAKLKEMEEKDGR